MLGKTIVKFIACWFFLPCVLMIMVADAIIWSVLKGYEGSISKFLVNGLAFGTCYKEWSTL